MSAPEPAALTKRPHGHCGMPTLVVTGLLCASASGDNMPSRLEMPLRDGFRNCNFLHGREENGEEEQQEMNLTPALGEKLRQQSSVLRSLEI